ncbi:MAG: hypothetical protein ACK4GO_03820 [Gemmobacter sp.]
MSLRATLLHSPPTPGAGRLLVTAALVWAAPAALGLCLMTGALLLGRLQPDLALPLWAIAAALLFSPLLSWIGWVLALPAVWLLLDRGRFGWLPAALIGLLAGAIAAAITDSELATGFGLVSLLALRALLPRTAPAA